jgi:hypothetical protein
MSIQDRIHRTKRKEMCPTYRQLSPSFLNHSDTNHPGCNCSLQVAIDSATEGSLTVLRREEEFLNAHNAICELLTPSSHIVETLQFGQRALNRGTKERKRVERKPLRAGHIENCLLSLPSMQFQPRSLDSSGGTAHTAGNA